MLPCGVMPLNAGEKKKDLEKEFKVVNEPEYIEEQARKQLKGIL